MASFGPSRVPITSRPRRSAARAKTDTTIPQPHPTSRLINCSIQTPTAPLLYFRAPPPTHGDPPAGGSRENYPETLVSVRKHDLWAREPPWICVFNKDNKSICCKHTNNVMTRARTPPLPATARRKASLLYESAFCDSLARIFLAAHRHLLPPG